MNCQKLLLAGVISACTSNTSHAGDLLELETTFIKGNIEMPQIIYIVPWQDSKDSKADVHKDQTLVLHSLFGDLFEPVYFEYGQATGQASLSPLRSR